MDVDKDYRKMAKLGITSSIDPHQIVDYDLPIDVIEAFNLEMEVDRNNDQNENQNIRDHVVEEETATAVYALVEASCNALLTKLFVLCTFL